MADIPDGFRFAVVIGAALPPCGNPEVMTVIKPLHEDEIRPALKSGNPGAWFTTYSTGRTTSQFTVAHSLMVGTIDQLVGWYRLRLIEAAQRYFESIPIVSGLTIEEWQLKLVKSLAGPIDKVQLIPWDKPIEKKE